MSEYLKVLAKRAKKWAEIIEEGKTLKHSITLKRYVRKGIPGEHRGMVSNPLNFKFYQNKYQLFIFFLFILQKRNLKIDYLTM